MANIIRRDGKLSKRKITVDDLLGYDDFNVMVEALTKKREVIDQCVLLYTEKGSGVVHWICNALTYGDLLWILKKMEIGIVTQPPGEEECNENKGHTP